MMCRASSSVMRIATLLTGAVVLCLQGCAPICTFRSPEVLALGEKGVGIGVVTIDWRGGADHRESLPSLWVRSAVAENTDIGVSIGAFGTAFDVKRVFVRGPILVSGDLGLSYGSEDIMVDPAVVVAPAVMVGTDHLYGGVWGAYALTGDDGVVAQGISLGVSVGDKLRLMGEYDYFQRGDDDVPSSAYGVGLQLIWGG